MRSHIGVTRGNVLLGAKDKSLNHLLCDSIQCVCPLHSVLSEAVEMTLSSPNVKAYSQSRQFTYLHTIFAKFWLLSSTEIM